MKFNTAEVAGLNPDYLGFIFYEDSKRNFNGPAVSVPPSIKKVGVFVDASLEYITEMNDMHQFQVVQLHGDETPEFCGSLRQLLPDIELWKVFGIIDEFDFNRLTPYEQMVDKFLFDTKGVEKGGNGYTFDWTVLQGYPSEKPFILSGGIGLNEVPDLKNIFTTELPVFGIDVNSRFEVKPGLKDVELLKEFIDEL